ncbi:MAG: class I tRNA ligase family protein [Christensenellales bacterium]
MKDYGDERLKRMIEHRPVAPKRAVVTGGMPYGNKDLHYGHVLGMFLYADFMARFLRDRIGKDNVIFVSGTDCYGSPAMETLRKKQSEGYTGTMQDMVLEYHNRQKADLDKFQISLDFFGASAVGEAVPFHNQTSAEIFNKLYDNGYLKKMSTLQFYDESKGVFLNGRQVIGKCPYENCASEKGYADECDLGHQYQPKELIDPVSTLSGERPVLKEIGNWYFDLPRCLDLLNEWVERLTKTEARPFFLKEIKEFFKKPEIYIKKDQMEKFEEIGFLLPTHELREEKSKASFVLVFDKLEDREFACEMLSDNGIRYRTGKTLTPFRLSGNISWGVPLPDKDGFKDLTFYVWPESLWAPISFTKTYLNSLGRLDDWKKYWCSKDSYIYQVLGEDNMYFYGPVQHAMWLCTQGKNPTLDIPEGELNMSHLIVNKHSLFLGNKASSSGNIKPPKPNELLEYYSVEQLRMHFLGLSVGTNSSSFTPKPFDPDAKPEDIDPVTKDGNLLTNVYNRILRTLFYTWQSRFDGVVPERKISENILKDATLTILKYEKLMFDNKFHMVMYELDSYIRNINKYWVANIKTCEEDNEKLSQLIADTLHMCKVAMVLLHPVSPVNIEKLAEDLKVNKNIFSWETINNPIYDFVDDRNNYRPKFIEARYDFFSKPACQFE